MVIKAANAAGEPELHAYPVDITKDHGNNDVLTFRPWTREPLEEVPIQFRFLPDKL